MTEEEIDDLCAKHRLVPSHIVAIHADGGLYYTGFIHWGGKGYKELPVNFSYVSGTMYLDSCPLTSLKGLPRIMNGSLHLSDCSALTSLEGLPESVHGDLDLSLCIGITSLAGITPTIHGKLMLTGMDALCDFRELAGVKCNMVVLTDPRDNINVKYYKPAMVLAGWYQLCQCTLEQLCEYTLTGHHMFGPAAVHWVIQAKQRGEVLC